MTDQNSEDNSAMDILEFVVKPHQNAAKKKFNNSKNNKNMINFWGVTILGVIFFVMAYFPIASRFGGISVAESALPAFIFQCCAPILLPAIFFMHKPKHLISVLKDLNFL